MHISITQAHAAMDKFPQFLSTIRAEFPDDCEAIADQIIDAELGDFCWESRIAERSIGIIGDLFDDEEGVREEVRILGYFRGQYLVATCIVDAERRLQWMPKVRHFEALSDGEGAFLAGA
jgi:hypothetical protein